MSIVNLNEPAATTQSTPDPEPVVFTEPPAAEISEHTAADEIDTDDLESLLTDLQKSKKLNKAAPKPRIRKPKTKATVIVEDIPVVVEPVVVEAVVAKTKPKRKYTKKPNNIPEAVPEAVESATLQRVEEPVKRSPANMIEEMQRAERALRYQMRKHMMETLVSQAS